LAVDDGVGGRLRQLLACRVDKLEIQTARCALSSLLLTARNVYTSKPFYDRRRHKL